VNPDFLIAGGPKWIDSDRFDVDAKAAGDFPPADRFQLKVHHQLRPGPTYALVFAKDDRSFGPPPFVVRRLRRGDRTRKLRRRRPPWPNL
jgi:uncharacterized protein (TIGR03435 family)